MPDSCLKSAKLPNEFIQVANSVRVCICFTG